MGKTPLAIATILLAASASPAATVEVTDLTDLGGGMYGYTLTALGQDGHQMSFFVDVTVECLDPGVDQIPQMKAVIIPGQLEYDVNTENSADLYHGTGTPPYDKYRDSWWGDPFYLHGCIAVEQWDTCLMRLESGTNPNEWNYENAKVAYICLTGRARVHGDVYRGGDPYPFDFTIPEPACAGFLVLGFLALRRRGTV